MRVHGVLTAPLQAVHQEHRLNVVCLPAWAPSKTGKLLTKDTFFRRKADTEVDSYEL